MALTDPVTAKLKILNNPQDLMYKNCPIEKICDDILQCLVVYEDIAEIIECKSYELCKKGEITYAMNQLIRVANFFETLENKNEEHSRDLADIYLLIGQMFQYADKYNDSIPWFSKSIVVDDQYSVPYHNLAISYRAIGCIDQAIRCLKQEILLAPGNYYSYLILADIYEQKKMFQEYENCLNGLLERDPENILGLHRLIKYYEKIGLTSDTSLLFKRMNGINKNFNTTEYLIKIYYLCKFCKYDEALHLCLHWESNLLNATVVHLVKAHVYGLQKKRNLQQKEIELFNSKNNGKSECMKSKIDEFASIFGKKYITLFSKKLIELNP